MFKEKKYSLSEAKAKILGYCAKKECCHNDVRAKLREWNVLPDHAEHLICFLIEYNFLNESRYSRLYARSKFNQNSWGWQKIKMGLRNKYISDYCIQEAYMELDPDEYTLKLTSLMESKKASLSGSVLSVKGKVYKYLVQKGYEFKLINDIYRENYDKQ